MKKIISILLSLCMVFTVVVPSIGMDTGGAECPAPSKVYDKGNSQNGELNYICFGDSMSNGFGLPEYEIINEEKKTPKNFAGFDCVTPGMYADVIAENLNKKYGYKVNLFQYALTGVRIEDMLALISTNEKTDSNYYGGDAYTKKYLIEDRIAHFFNGENNEDKEQLFNNAKKNIQAAINEADFITVCLGMNTFVCLLEDRLGAWSNGSMGGSDHLNVDAFKLEDVLSPEGVALYNKLANTLETVLKKQLGDNAGDIPALLKNYLNDQIYALASLGEGYKKFCNRLYELNKDADVVFIGFPDSVKGYYVTIELNVLGKKRNIDINIGEILNSLMVVINTFIAFEAASYKGNARFVDFDDVKLVYSDIAKLGSGDWVDFNKYYENLVLEEIAKGHFADTAKALVNAVAENNIEKDNFNIENIKEGVRNIQEEPDVDASYLLEAQVYLGFRDAIIDLLNFNDENRYNYINAIDYLPYLGIGDKETGLESFLKDQTKVAELKNADSLRAKICKVLKSDGIRDDIFIYARTDIGGGRSGHTSLQGHKELAEKVVAAYEKLQKTKMMKETVKKAVPVIVGGVAVTLVSASVVKTISNMKNFVIVG